MATIVPAPRRRKPPIMPTVTALAVALALVVALAV